jgi:hypothetical protein
MKTDSNMDFDGMKGNGVNRSTNKFTGNQHAGVQNPNALINKGRGPTGGGKEMPYCGKEMTMGSSNPQKRQAVSDGQTKSIPNRGKEKFDFARGPTKGNM